MSRSVEAIDALLATDKTIFGAPRWVERVTDATLTSALVGTDGAIIGGLSLELRVLTHLPAPRGFAVLVLDKLPLCRLSFRPDNAHSTPGREPVPPALRFLKLPAGPSRIYRWPDDRCWPRPGKQGVAAPLELEPNDVESAFAQFCRECRIGGALPPPPHRPRLEL